MEIAHWKFIAVIVAIIATIVCALLGDSKKVTPKQGKFFNTLAVLLFVALVVGGAYWFFSTPASHS